MFRLDSAWEWEVPSARDPFRELGVSVTAESCPLLAGPKLGLKILISNNNNNSHTSNNNSNRHNDNKSSIT